MQTQDFDLKVSFPLTIITPAMEALETHLLCLPCRAWCSVKQWVVSVLPTLMGKQLLPGEGPSDLSLSLSPPPPR